MPKLSFLCCHRCFSKKRSTQANEIQNPLFTQIRTDQPTMEEVKTAFSNVDTNGDGKISLEEYMQAVKALGLSNEVASMQFRVLDVNGDGFIDLEEFRKAFPGGREMKRSDLQALFRVFDADGDEKISAEELMGFLRRIGEICSLDGCKEIIRMVDRDGDGYIDMDEFMNIMAQSFKIV